MTGTCSVVLPAYNAASFIVETLESVLAETRRPDQLIVVDDASSDATAELAGDWLSAHPEMNGRLLRNDRTRGASFARNRGIAASTTDYIATLDADDLVEPDHLRLLLEPLDADNSVVLGFGDAREFDESGPASATMLERSRARVPPGLASQRYTVLRDGLVRSLLPGSYVPVSGSAFRRETAMAIGLYDPTLARVEDRDFLLRLAAEGGFALIPNVVCRKRIHTESASGPRHQVLMAAGAFAILRKTSERLRGGSPTDERACLFHLENAARNYLYQASTVGLVPFRKAAAEVREAGFRLIAANPKGWARSWWCDARRRTAD